MFTVKSAAILAVLLWVLMLYYLSAQLFGLQVKGYEREEIAIQLDEALQHLKELRKQNANLQQLIDNERRESKKHSGNVRSQDQKEEKLVEVSSPGGEVFNSLNRKDVFSLDHEVSRRLIESRIWEVFYYIRVMDSDSPKQYLVKKHVEEQLMSLLGTMSNFSEVDGAAAWRQKSLQTLTDFIQGRIYKMQHPEDCKKAKILICDLDKPCGFGCQMHHIAFCLMTAFGLQRTMILHDDGNTWRYSQKGWLGTFLPITQCRYNDVTKSETAEKFSINSEARIVQLGIVDLMVRLPDFLPLSIPRPLSEELLKLHSNPPAFFVGQFLWYLMRSGDQVNKMLKLSISLIPFGKGPIVGLQIRRTDKVGTEAAFHDVDEYMQWTEIWYKIQEKRHGQNLTRRIFVATDDPSVLSEIKQKYPQYDMYGDEKTANTAKLDSRYSDSSLYGVIRDVRLLSLCDYIVCTFSSQVCRIGFELMQIEQGDAGNRFHSLDDIYYFGGQHAHEVVAVEDHNPERVDEIELRVGDMVGIAGNHWNGYSKGVNRRTGASGLYPSYKVIEKWRIVDFPSLQ